MATPTYTPIASITLGSSASSVTFSSIPQDYRDLVLAISGTGTTAADIFIELNNATTNYSRVTMGAQTGGSTYSFSNSNLQITYYGQLTTSQGNWIVEFMDYSATDKHKTYLVRSNNQASGVHAQASRYASTTAITQIDLRLNTGSFATGTTFALYGIAA